MLWKSVYVAGTGADFPRKKPVEEAIDEGLYDPKEAATSQQLSVTVADADNRAADFAVRAARQALQRSGYEPADIGMIGHAIVLDAGIPVWNSASYVQRGIGASRCDVVTELRSACAGGVVGLILASSYLETQQDHAAALVTTADCWPPDAIDRWRTVSGAVFGDGGTALLLSRDGGFARVVSTSTATDPELEALGRGNQSFGFRGQYPIDLDRRAREFMTTMPSATVWQRRDTAVRTAVDAATSEAGVKLSDIDFVVYSFTGRRVLNRECLKPLGLSIDRTLWNFGRTIGHLGAGDTLAGLNHLVESGRLHPGTRTLLIGLGSGMIWSVAVIETLAEPRFG